MRTVLIVIITMKKGTKKKLFIAGSTILGVWLASRAKKHETIAFIASSTAGSLLADLLFDGKQKQLKK